MRGQIVEARGSVAFFENQLEQHGHPGACHRHDPRARRRERRVRHHQLRRRTRRQRLRRLPGEPQRSASRARHQPERFRQARTQQKGIVTTDAYPDRKYEGVIDEISPEANRQKATVQVKVKIQNPDDYLRPEMNSSVAFVGRDEGTLRRKPVAFSIYRHRAVKDNAVFVVSDGKALQARRQNRRQHDPGPPRRRRTLRRGRDRPQPALRLERRRQSTSQAGVTHV